MIPSSWWAKKDALGRCELPNSPLWKSIWITHGGIGLIVHNSYDNKKETLSVNHIYRPDFTNSNYFSTAEWLLSCKILQMRKHRLAFETVKGSVILLTLSNIRDEKQKEKLLFAHDTIDFARQCLKIGSLNELDSYSPCLLGCTPHPHTYLC